jgi:hypothetical protein
VERMGDSKTFWCRALIECSRRYSQTRSSKDLSDRFVVNVSTT